MGLRAIRRSESVIRGGSKADQAGRLAERSQQRSARAWRGVFFCWLAAVTAGCEKRIDQFDTSQGDAYCGRIVGAPFVREGFDRQIQLQLHVDTAHLNTIPGDISTDDSDIGRCAPKPLFSSNQLRAPSKLESDALSAFSFGDSSLLNLLTWVDSTCDGTYLAVVSLMNDEQVEVRLLHGVLDKDGKEAGSFGVFKLQRTRGSCNFAAP